MTFYFDWDREKYLVGEEFKAGEFESILTVVPFQSYPHTHHGNERIPDMPKKKCGFAVMPKARLQAISKKGGQNAQRMGLAHRFTADEARAAVKVREARKAARK